MSQVEVDVVGRVTPACNTEVTPGPVRAKSLIWQEVPNSSIGQILTRFDYYRASVGSTSDAETENVISQILSAGFGVSAAGCRPMYNYTRGFNFVDPRDGVTVLATVLSAEDYAPCVQASGWAAHEVWSMLREPFVGQLRLARGDVCVDANGDDAFEELDTVLRSLALVRGVTLDQRGDWDSPGSPRGRTRYVGNRKSVAFRRLYEHFKHHGHGSAVRYELECKPDSRHKVMFGGFSPVEVLRSDDFSRRFLGLCGIPLDGLTLPRDVERPVGRPFKSVMRQYGSLLESQLLEVFGGDLVEMWAAMLAERQRQREE